MFFACHVLPLVDRAISPRLLALTVLKVVLPEAFIHGTVNVMIYSVTICFIVYPLAIIDISIDVNKPTFAVSPIILPLSFVDSTIWPLLDSPTIPEPTDPLTIVSGSRLKCISRSFFLFSIRIIHASFRDGFLAFINREVSRVSLQKFKLEKKNTAVLTLLEFMMNATCLRAM
jgi:hypothetical protein